MRSNPSLIVSRRRAASPLSLLAVTVLTMTLGACCAPPPTGPAPAIEYPAASEWMQTQLFFGLMRLDGGVVHDHCWREFLDREILPRFPDGLTVLNAEGRYLDATRRLHKEPSRVVVVLYPNDQAKDADLRIRAIAARYITDFDQESVMRLDSTQAVTFIQRKDK